MCLKSPILTHLFDDLTIRKYYGVVPWVVILLLISKSQISMSLKLKKWEWDIIIVPINQNWQGMLAQGSD